MGGATGVGGTYAGGGNGPVDVTNAALDIAISRATPVRLAAKRAMLRAYVSGGRWPDSKPPAV